MEFLFEGASVIGTYEAQLTPLCNMQVRIFVEMDKVQSAQQAVAALNGRYFDQKIISASFFDEARFQAMDLAPKPDELT
jgi:lipase chaperone LimK